MIFAFENALTTRTTTTTSAAAVRVNPKRRPQLLAVVVAGTGSVRGGTCCRGSDSCICTGSGSHGGCQQAAATKQHHHTDLGTDERRATMAFKMAVKFANWDNTASPLTLELPPTVTGSDLKALVLEKWPTGCPRPDGGARNMVLIVMGRALVDGQALGDAGLPRYDWPTPLHVAVKQVEKAPPAAHRAGGTAAGGTSAAAAPARGDDPSCCCVIA